MFNNFNSITYILFKKFVIIDSRILIIQYVWYTLHDVEVDKSRKQFDEYRYKAPLSNCRLLQ